MRAILLLFITICITGCNKKEQNEVEMTQVKKENILRINSQGELSSLHPHKGVDLFCRNYQRALFEGLFRRDENDVPQQALAERYEVSNDGKSYTFYLRPSQWTNGEAVTAHHFKQAWTHAIKPTANSVRADLFFPIKNAKKCKLGELPMDELGIDVIDDHTLTIHLEHPTPYLLDLLAHPVLSPLYELEEEPTVYNGPFMVTRYDREECIIIEKNPSYWDHKNVHLERIEGTFVSDPNTVLMMYDRGEIDWAGSPFTWLPIDSYQHVAKSPDYGKKPAAGVYWYSLNTKQFPLNSKKIRRALSVVLNREDLCKHVLFGETPSKTVLPSHLSSLSQSELYKDNDLRGAQKLFNEGLEDLNVRREDLPPLEISYSDIPGQKKLAEALQQIWEKAFNVKIKLIPSEWNVYFANILSKQYQIGGLVWFAGFNDATYHLEFFKELNGRLNIYGFDNKKFAQLLDLADNELDPRIRSEHLKQAELILLEEMPVIPIYNYSSRYLLSDRVGGIQISLLGEADLKGVYLKQHVHK